MQRTRLVPVALLVSVASLGAVGCVRATEEPLPTSVAPVKTTAAPESAPEVIDEPAPIAIPELPINGIRLRILTFNIHHGEGSDGTVDLGRIADLINMVKPDLVSLQEVESGTERTGKVDQPRVLADLTGLEPLFGSNIDFRGGGYGNAILSAHPIIAARNHLLPFEPDNEHRGVLQATIELPDGHHITLLSTHLDHHDAPNQRLASLKAINDVVGGLGGQPVVLAADLNAEPSSQEISRLVADWMAVGSLRLLTYPAVAPVKRIDYVFVHPASRWVSVSAVTLGDPTISDHRALLVTVELAAWRAKSG